MATLTIRRLDDGVYERLRTRAKANGRSLEAEARTILTEQARDHDSIIKDLVRLNAEMGARHGLVSDSTQLLRAMREEE